ncbi:hypothetical protein RCH16_003416 [Cryobacterium sp. MP_M5]|uniref:hypothetical protein n=1 Tax=unclassified Cryobacterium TaxID=2649013 RepID=UPI0018CA7DF0|nr:MULTISPECIES: hypothetical protein [unclassified Cryobacterium]MBG6059959.1 hypothetical protein [Cryobacterium sp. MP_M3]MEC5178377.1 hypothetical protein [Cryobacterium sp. MP_M5]
MAIELYFTQYFGVTPEALEEYGAFDISLASDLPLFVDPFLLFNSERPEYKALHEDIIKYLTFLRDRAGAALSPALIKAWYKFSEVKQNWLGFTLLGNSGSGLGNDFARALHDSLGSILKSFGSETITKGSHLEKLALVKDGVGRDNISDFTTNLIKGYLLGYTQDFARKHLSEGQRARFPVARAEFNYDTETWATRTYELPIFRGDFVLLTPADMLTRDDTWISRADMLHGFSRLPDAVPDDQLRAQINNYFGSMLSKEPTKEERSQAAQSTLRRYPELIDYYIREKEDTGEQAIGLSAKRREETQGFLVEMVKAVVADLSARTSFYLTPQTSYAEALFRAKSFKQYIEDQDGYKLINRPGHERAFSNEKDVQLYFGLAFVGSEYDVNREVNNGRGPVDFKVSKGAFDKSLIEVKLASNSHLKRNLQKQIEIYEKANGTRTSVKMIVCYTAAGVAKVDAILGELKLLGEESIVVIDARADNKPSGSRA